MIKALIRLLGIFVFFISILQAGAQPDTTMSHADSVALLEAYSVFLDYPVSLDTIDIELDSLLAVQMFQKYQLLTMMSADPEITKTAWSRVERKRYPRYDISISPPADSLYYRLYRAQNGRMTACTFQGDHYVIENQYPFGDSLFIERRYIVPEVDIGLISPRLASPLFVMTTKRNTVTFPFRFGTVIAFDTCRHAELLARELDSVVMVVEKTFGIKADSTINVYLVADTREMINSPLKVVSWAIPENNMLLADQVAADFGEESRRNAMTMRIGRELVHVVISGSESFGMGYVYQPPIREGLSAMLFGNGTRTPSEQKNLIQSLLKGNTLRPLDTMLTQYDSLDAETKSAFAGCFLRFLLDRYGIDSFAAFCRSYQSHGDMTAMLKTVLDTDVATLDKEWRKYIKNKQP